MEEKTSKFMVMNNQNGDVRLTNIILKYDFHTLLFSKIVGGITDRDLHLFDKDSNCIPWLIGSQVQLRFEIANTLGIVMKQEANELFIGNKGGQPGIKYPSLHRFKHDWDKISPILRDEILQLGNEDLFAFSKSTPELKETFFDLLSNTIDREHEIINIITVWRGLFMTSPNFRTR